MAECLKAYFPMIRDREEVLFQIRSSETLSCVFNTWKWEYQEEFLDFCTGVKGVRILYDTFFKELFNPNIHPERLEELLSLILKVKVKY